MPRRSRLPDLGSHGVYSNLALTAGTVVETPLATTVDPLANAATQSWLAKLKSLADNGNTARVLTGYQINYAQSSRVSTNLAVATDLQSAGAYPAIFGIDLDTGFKSSLASVLSSTLGTHAAAGGVVLATAHTDSPGTPRNPGTYTYVAGSNECDFAQLTTPGTATYIAWQARLSTFADFLSDLETRGVTVIMRPFHESNLSSWWWSKKNPTVTSTLWALAIQQMQDYYHVTRGIHNLLWAYGPFLSQTEVIGSVSPTYPGDANFDVLAVSNYPTYTGTGAYPSAYRTRTGEWHAAHPTMPILWGELGPPVGTSFDLAPMLAALKHSEQQYIVGFNNWDGSFRPELQSNYTTFWADAIQIGRGETIA